MKHKLTLAFLLLTAMIFAQSPRLINYQGVLRGKDGLPVPDQSIGIQFEVLQGATNPTVAFSETQSIKTNSLGMILTQIGLVNNLSTLSWKNGPYALRVSVDVQGGSNYVPLSTQQIVGVPYAFHASTVPGSYTASTNVLDIGGNTFTLASTPNTTIFPLGIASVTTAATNSIILDVPTPSFTASGPVTITGAYPNFTLSSPPVTTITAAGIASVSSAGTNSFNVGVPSPSFTANGPVSISGTYPNMTVTAPPTTSVSGNGIVSVTAPSTNSYVVSVPQTSITVTNTAGTGAVSTAGTNSFNINIPAGVTPSMSGAGAAVVSPAVGNSFTVTVPQTSVTLTQTGTTSGVSSTGQNSFNINVAPQVTPTITPAGAVTATSSGFNYTVSAPAVTLTPSGAAQITPGGTNNFTINVPTTQISSGGGIGISSPAQNQFILTVPPTTINQAGVANVTGTNNNFTVNVPGTNVTGGGVANVTSSGTNTFNVTVPGANVTGGGVANVTSSGTNTFNVTVPGTSVTGTGAATITTSGTNTFNVNVPAANVSGAGVAVVTSAGTNSFNVTVPGTSLTSSGAAVVTPAGTNTFNISVPQTSVVVTSVAGAPGYTSTGTNSVTINVPPAITQTLVGTGLASVTTGANAFTVNVPVLSYTGTSGTLGSGTNTVNITPLVSITQNTLTVGPSSNSVSLIGISPWRQATGAVTLATTSDKVGIGGGAPTENLQVESGASTSVSILGGASNSSELFFGTSANHTLGRIRFDNNTSNLGLWTNNTSSAVNINSSGQMVIGTNSPFATTTGLTISRNGAFNNQLMITGGDNNNTFGGILSFAENLNYVAGMSLKLDAGSNRLIFTNDLTGSNPVAAITGYGVGSTNGVVIGSGYAGGINPPTDGLLVQGNFGVGSFNPGTKMEVIGDISIPNGNKIQFGTNSSGSGIGEWIQNSATGLQLRTASLPRINITTSGDIGLNTTTPAANLHHIGTSLFQGASNVQGNLTVGTSAALPNDARVFGAIRVGNETGTSMGPSYPSGSNGMILRRVFTNQFNIAGEIVAITDNMSLQRDGTNGGFRIVNASTVAPGNEICNCMGVNSVGGSVNKAFNNLGLGATQVYNDLENIVYFHCIFGDPFNAGHITEITFTRQFADWFWMGTVLSTFNQ